MTVNISLPDELVKQIDAAAKADYESRSDFLRKAALNQLRATTKMPATTSAQSEYDQAIAAGKAILAEHSADFKHLAQR